MTRFLGMLVVLFAVFAAFGWYRGWFHADATNADGQHTVSVTVDNDKFNQDKASAQQQVQDLGHK